MTIHFQSALPEDLKAIMAIENSGFSKAEAATETSMSQRIQLISDTFITAKDDQGTVLGYVVGPAFSQRYLTDALFQQVHQNDPKDAYQTVLSLAVARHQQQQGIASSLLDQLAKVARTQHRVAITLTCLQRLVPFYQRNGYQNEGVSQSDHAGEVWYNMVFTI